MGSIVSTMASGMTEYYKGKEAWRQTKREMGYQRLQSAEEVRRMENELEEIKGVEKTQYAASGVRTDEGSPMDVMLDTEREGRYRISFKKFMDAAQLFEMRKAGRLQKRAGEMALWGSAASVMGQIIATAVGGLAGGAAGAMAGSMSGQGTSSGSDYQMRSPFGRRYSSFGRGSGGGFNYWSLLGNL